MSAHKKLMKRLMRAEKLLARCLDQLSAFDAAHDTSARLLAAECIQQIELLVELVYGAEPADLRLLAEEVRRLRTHNAALMKQLEETVAERDDARRALDRGQLAAPLRRCPDCGALEGKPHDDACPRRGPVESWGAQSEEQIIEEQIKDHEELVMTKAKERTLAAEAAAKDDWEAKHGVRPKVIIGMDRGMPKATAQGAAVAGAQGAMLDEIRAALHRAQTAADKREREPGDGDEMT